jgi:hypothetical protein
MRISCDGQIGSTYLLVGASSSTIFSEIYLQYMEHSTFVDILIQQKMLGFC